MGIVNNRVLITGSNGLLGQKLVGQLLKENTMFLATSQGDNRNPECPTERYLPMDICSDTDVDKVFERFRPTHVIHTAAITNVDYCEENPEACEKVNVKASKRLFEACEKLGAHFQFLSTDFVFNGEKGNYRETDQPDPLSVYARSKFKTEQLLLTSDYKNWSIVRTIIVYGTGHNLSRSNIVLWAKESLQEGKEMNVVTDQFRAPTFVPDLAKGCLEILARDKKGIFHLSGPQTLSIHELVLRIADYFQYDKRNVKGISSATLNQAAKRPPRTGFDLAKAKRELDYAPHTLEESLAIIFG